jgi:hypothetical protein
LLQQHGEAVLSSTPVQPLVRFTFDDNPTNTSRYDDSGAIGLEFMNGANAVNGALVVDGKGFAVSQPLPRSIMPTSITQKTLEAWVQLDSFQQRGGGVISIQSKDGARFDSIVFGEQTPGQWMAGSEFFARTKPFQGYVEAEATQRMVHLAIVYEPDGTIVGYRDGKAYGQPYKTEGLLPFEPGDTVISFGVRHLPASNGKMLVGRIFEARLYDRALNATEIESSFQSFQYGFQLSSVPEWLDEKQKVEWQQLQQQSRELAIEIESLPLQPSMPAEQQVWSDIARSFFMMKEFLFIK